MSKKKGNEIHDAYMEGLYEGEKRILNMIGALLEDAIAEIKKEKEAQE